MSLAYGISEKLEMYPALAPDLLTLVFGNVRVTSDVWLMDNFDPEEESK